ncbi:hypothetical protein INT43_002917 [Umbelopsis isabellina]|uniref:Kinesin-domain-containing protein n=1 Tax=Mortierella isabellina TaxID=91625 RepID=A0A8H7PCS4_MORIS|nr:hypothetical protein INT43_002917 [Umbelopsis isabellina]
MSGGGNVKVVVRCRPLNQREIARNSSIFVRMNGNQTILEKPTKDEKGPKEEDIKAFTFDKSFWSVEKNDPNYAGQDTVYKDLGEDLLEHAFDGYNCCIFAYGQTGSGKSYSMMGYGEDKGIIPRACQELFDRISHTTEEHLTHRVEVTYIEIYNEKVRDLLNPKNKDNLRVREHPRFGPYVEDLSRLVVNSFEDINHLMDEGNKARTVAATNMNETSSRSHAVFTIFLTQRRHDVATKLNTEKVARISLVDLAGSERANSSGATGARLKEGANINRSLTTLGKVIAALAEQSQHEGKRGRKKESFIPYRDSVSEMTLTWLLKDSLGGNSKTTMIATISPASENYEETLSTLRYADQAKKIKNKAIVNEDPNAKLIRELKAELEFLKDKLMLYAPEEVRQLATSNAYFRGNGKQSAAAKIAAAAIPASQEIVFTDQDGNVRKMTREEIIEQMLSSEKLFNELNETWEEKLKRTESVQIEREQALAEMGVTVAKNRVGVYTPKKVPHLVNLNEDPLMSECLMYQIKPGLTLVGRQESNVNADIRLTGPNILDKHCYFENTNGTVVLFPSADSMTMVNGRRIKEATKLSSGYRIILGDYHVFRFNNPEEVRRERNLQKSVVSSNLSATEEPFKRPESPTMAEPADWRFAQREAILNESDFGDMDDEELEKLFDDISKVRNLRRSRPESRMEEETSSHSGSSSRAVTSPAMLNNDSEVTDKVELSAATVSNTDVEEKLRLAKEEMKRQLESQRNEYEVKLKAVEASTLPADKLKSERDEMRRQLQEVQDQMEQVLEQQKQEYENKLKRISQKLPEPLLNGYTATQWKLIRKTVTKWKQMRDILMIEAVLLNSVILKESNVIAKELGKSVLFQFCVLAHEHLINSKSFWEYDTNSQSNEDDSDVIGGSLRTPCVGVRVMDSKHSVVYHWSLEKLKQRLQRMRNLYNFIDRPMYRKHFNWEDPFYDHPTPHFTHIGTAMLPMRNLCVQLPFQSQVHIISPITDQKYGNLTVLVTPLACSPSVGKSDTFVDKETDEVSIQSDEVADDQVQLGQQLLFEVQIIGAEGISESDCTQVHAQFRLSAFGNVQPYSTKDKIFCSDLISDFGNGAIELGFTQTISVVATRKTLKILKYGYMPIELYGRLQPGMIESFREWDAGREAQNDTIAEKSSATKFERIKDARDEPLHDEQVDIFASVQLAELAPEGEYLPTQVLLNGPSSSGIFLLRQGIQRRVMFRITHTSGRQFVWEKIGKASFGNVRSVDDKGKVVEEAIHDPVPLNLLAQQKVEYHPDGTSTLEAQGAWDSSLHEATILNQITTAGHQVQLTLEWEIETDKCEAPLKLSTQLYVQVQGRDVSTPSMLRTLITPTRTADKITAIYLVHLRPPATRKINELWRYCTTNGYVRGEEFLGNWKPRSISMVSDYQRNKSHIQHIQEVANVRQWLHLRGDENMVSNGTHMLRNTRDSIPESKVELVKNIVRIWRNACKYTSGAEIIRTRHKAASAQEREPWKAKKARKLIPYVTLVTTTDIVTKKGYLSYPENADDIWVKRWIVFKRPYLHIYLNQSDSAQQGIINLSHVKVDYKKDLENMLERDNVFAIYTSNNAYLFQASSRAEMIDWIAKIDQFYPVQALKDA